MSEHLAQNHPRVKRNILVLIPIERSKQDIRLGVEVFNRGRTRPDLPPEEVIEDLHDVLARLEFEPVDVQQEVVQ